MYRKLIIVLMMAIGMAASAKTFHAIVFCNTIDQDIGGNMQVELSNMNRHIAILEKALEADYEFDVVSLDGRSCTRSMLKSVIDEMEVGSDDVIFTFYGGHGTHAPNNAEDPWPQFLMNSGFENQGNWVPMALLDKWVAAKNPRLRIVMANCCNVVQDGVTIKPMWASQGRSTPMDGINSDNFRKLFAQRGNVMATAAKLGQYSWCNSLVGGVYTNKFLNSLINLGKGNIAPTWDALLAEAKRLTDNEPIRDRNNKAWNQNPYHKINISDESVIVPPTIKPKKEPVISEQLQSTLCTLVDKSIPAERRLAMINQVARQFFPAGTKVVTIAADMKTAVDYEEPTDFLRRICLSKYINGMAVLSQDNKIIKVHELN